MFTKSYLALPLSMRPTVCVENFETVKNEWSLLKILAALSFHQAIVWTPLDATVQPSWFHELWRLELIWRLGIGSLFFGELNSLRVAPSSACRNWLLEWTNSPTPAFKTILSGPISSFGKPPSTQRSKTRSERCTLLPLRTNSSSLPRSRYRLKDHRHLSFALY